LPLPQEGALLPPALALLMRTGTINPVFRGVHPLLLVLLLMLWLLMVLLTVVLLLLQML